MIIIIIVIIENNNNNSYNDNDNDSIENYIYDCKGEGIASNPRSLR